MLSLYLDSSMGKGSKMKNSLPFLSELNLSSTLELSNLGAMMGSKVLFENADLSIDPILVGS